MFHIDGLRFSYNSREKEVLSDINLSIEDGQTGILLGSNGSGKTTLFKNIIGIEKPTFGEIYYDDTNLLSLSREMRAKVVAYVPQHIHFGALTVYESILMGRVAYFGFKAGKEDFQKTESVIEEMGLSKLAYRNAEKLSGGEKQKVAIARAIAQEPKLLVMDEPTGNLDIANEHLIVDEIKRLSRLKGITVLCSLHDLNRALGLGDKFFFMEAGKIKYSGDKTCFTGEVIKEIFAVDVDIEKIKGKDVVLQ